MTDIEGDPFGEKRRALSVRRHRVLGADIVFESESRELLALVDESFRDGPQHRGVRRLRELRLRLRLADDMTRRRRPPPMRFSAGGGILHGGYDGANFVALSPATGSGMIVVSRAILAHRELVRYELIEFAALTLAARSQALVPLHAACIASRGRGVLVLGDSGAGKSTLTLFAALSGLELVGEDNVFVDPRTMSATGHATRLYARRESLELLPHSHAREFSGAPRVRRRSGVVKHALDARRLGIRSLRMPRIIAVLHLTGRPAVGASVCTAVPVARLRELLRRTQPYAASQPQWRRFEDEASELPAFSMARTPPGDSVAIVRSLLMLGSP